MLRGIDLLLSESGKSITEETGIGVGRSNGTKREE